MPAQRSWGIRPGVRATQTEGGAWTEALGHQWVWKGWIGRNTMYVDPELSSWIEGVRQNLACSRIEADGWVSLSDFSKDGREVTRAGAVSATAQESWGGVGGGQQQAGCRDKGRKGVWWVKPARTQDAMKRLVFAFQNSRDCDWEGKQKEMPPFKHMIKRFYLYTAKSRTIWLRFSSSFKVKSSLRNNPFRGEKKGCL